MEVIHKQNVLPILLVDFGTVSTHAYFLFFILLHNLVRNKHKKWILFILFQRCFSHTNH